MGHLVCCAHGRRGERLQRRHGHHRALHDGLEERVVVQRRFALSADLVHDLGAQGPRPRVSGLLLHTNEPHPSKSAGLARSPCNGSRLWLCRHGVQPREQDIVLNMGTLAIIKQMLRHLTVCSKVSRVTGIAAIAPAGFCKGAARRACTACTGKLPAAVSPESMTQSVPSSTALATSVASARVGRGLLIMLSSICVAVMTGLPTCARACCVGPRTSCAHSSFSEAAETL